MDVVKVKTKIYLCRDNQGFLTSLNRYVDRKKGWIIARKQTNTMGNLEASQETVKTLLL
jgi:hypothetical protein